MKPKITTSTPMQLELDRHGAILAKIINPRHALVTLAEQIFVVRNIFDSHAVISGSVTAVCAFVMAGTSKHKQTSPTAKIYDCFFMISFSFLSLLFALFYEKHSHKLTTTINQAGINVVKKL